MRRSKASDIDVVEVKIYWLSFWLIQMLYFALTSVNLFLQWFARASSRSLSIIEENSMKLYLLRFEMTCWYVDSLSSLFIERNKRAKILNVHRPNHFSDAKCILYAIQCRFFPFLYFTLLIATLWLSLYISFIFMFLRFHHITTAKKIAFSFLSGAFIKFLFFRFKHINFITKRQTSI